MIYKLVPFNIVIDAQCLYTDFLYTKSATPLTHSINQAPVTYTLGIIDDQVSLDYTSFSDAHSYCRAREIQYTGIEPLEGQSAPAASMMTFNAATQTFSL